MISSWLKQLATRYEDRVWPENINQICLFTYICGGKGDIVAGAKIIALLLELNLKLKIDWVLSQPEEDFAHQLISTSRVHIRTLGGRYHTPIDLLIVGPSMIEWGVSYLEKHIGRHIDGPIFRFYENGSVPKIIKMPSNVTFDIAFEVLFADPTWCLGFDTGLLLDKPLLRITQRSESEYTFPKYLPKIKDLELLTLLCDLYTWQTSINFGYAHRPESWINFIRIVGMAEKEKPVLIILNSKGFMEQWDQTRLYNKLVEEDVQNWWTRYKYLRIIGSEDITLNLQSEGVPLTIVFKPSFSSSDMKCLQLAAERILATGDNSAIEAWCARCKLYLYEDVGNGGCKWRFLQQQVDVAAKISPSLSKLLAIFGKDRRLNQSTIDWGQINSLLTPELERETVEFCKIIPQKYSFDDIFKGAILRTLYINIPQEKKLFSSFYQQNLLNFVQGKDSLQELILDPSKIVFNISLK